MQITEGQNKAAGAVVELIAKEFGDNRQIHPATAIAAGARLAGSFLFRSFKFIPPNASPGSVVLSEEANEKGPVLINILGGVLTSFGVDPDPEKMNSPVSAESNFSFLETLQRIQDQAHVIMNQNNLNLEEMAYSCAMATAFIIKECRNDLPVESGFHTAVYGFIEGTKTLPPELNPPKPPKRSIFKFWK